MVFFMVPSNLTWSFTTRGGQQLDTVETRARAGVEVQLGDTVTSQQCAHCSLALQQRLVLTLQEAASGLVVRCAEAGSGEAEVMASAGTGDRKLSLPNWVRMLMSAADTGRLDGRRLLRLML